MSLALRAVIDAEVYTGEDLAELLEAKKRIDHNLTLEAR